MLFFNDLGMVDCYIAMHRTREAIELANGACRQLGHTARALTVRNFINDWIAQYKILFAFNMEWAIISVKELISDVLNKILNMLNFILQISIYFKYTDIRSNFSKIIKFILSFSCSFTHQYCITIHLHLTR